MDYHDDFDDLPLRPMQEKPSTVGVIGFISAMVWIGLFLVMLGLKLLLDQEELQVQVPNRTRWMLYWFLALDFMSFLAGLMALILGARGLASVNTHYRGWATAALVLGILEIIGTVVFGCFMGCAVFTHELLNRGG
ncbi:MAG: hypothetical protein EXS16_17520 [Gemmataceae bacterium]|nr:hypothetical protein [Gemmataceae bacterium]